MASIEGLWAVRFGSAQSREADLEGGVAMIESGRIFGGDSGFAYVGTVEIAAQKVEGELTIIRHNPKVSSIYGRNEDRFQLKFSGSRVNERRIEGNLNRPGFPGGRLVLTWVADAP